MELLQLYVVYDERLKPVDSNIGSFNRYNHKIDRINIEINEALPSHTFYLNVKRPDGTVNLLGYEVVQVDGTNYYFDVPAWVTEEDGLVEFSLVASTLSQVISFGKFYVDCIDTLQATAQATPDDPTFLSKVDKDLSTYEEVTLTDDTLARVYVDDDGEPSQMSVGALVDKAQQEIPFLSFENPTTHTPLLEGEVAWNETAGTIDIGMKGGNVTQQVGMETYIRVRNDDIVPIVDGNVVYSVGTVGNSGVVRVKLASASDDEISGRVIGCATETIAPNGVGYVTILGEVNGIDTSLMTPEATLYLGENGAFTETIPTAPTKKIIIGRVMRVAVNGSIYVRLQKGVSLKELDDVVQNGTATGGILVYDSVAGTWGTGDVTFTEADNDLYINTDLDKIVLNKDTEVNGNLNVKGILTQDGSAYETHLEQLYTEKDHIILRDGAVSGLGVGSYAGLFAKLADGTNNSGLVFDGNGMARVGDIGTDLASPDFSQTQALATREDTPVANGLAYWNDTLKRFDTNQSAAFDGSNIVTTNVIRSAAGVGNSLTINNSYVNTASTGTKISRNVADPHSALKVDLAHASSTGDILELQHQGVEVASINKTGVFTGNGLDIDGGILHYGQELFRQVWNITSIDTIYSDITTLPSGQGNGTVLPALTGGALPLKLYEYDGTLAEWVYLVQVRSHTLYTVLATGKIYRYTMSSPYFIEMTNKYDNASSGLTATNYQGAIDEVVEMIGDIDIPTLNEVTITNDDTASVPLTVNAMVGTTNYLQQWKINGVLKVGIYPSGTIYTDGYFYSSNGLASGGGVANSNVATGANGTVISRNIADSNPALEVNLKHASSTGNIAEFWSNVGGTTARRGYINKDGKAWFSSGINELKVTNDAIGDIPATINAITGTTANLLSLQVNSVEKASIGASGRGTFTSLSTGSNTLLGTAGLNITTGTSNVLIGYLTATFLTEGIENVAIGSKALNNAYTNNYSVAIGNRALERLLAGDNTIGIGHNAGRYYGYNYPVNGGDLTTSSNSIYIGNEASAKENSISNEIVIGYNALGNGSNTATIGNSSLTKLYAGSYEVDRVIKSSSISVSSWSADATYAGYGYRATITMTGATSSDSAEVVYAHAEAISGNYSPICETLTNGVYIYSKVNTTITLAQVIVHKA